MGKKIKKLAGRLGCHQRADRSFFYKGHQFPLCARCTGVAIGQIMAIGMRFIVTPNLYLCFAFCLVLLIDWSIQYFRIRESTNPRRFVTGILCGYGMLSIEIELIIWTIGICTSIFFK